MILTEGCLECGAVMKVEEIGVTVLEKTEKGEPYKLWAADVLICPKCDRQVVTRFADSPYARMGQSGFDKAVKAAKAYGCKVIQW